MELLACAANSSKEKQKAAAISASASDGACLDWTIAAQGSQQPEASCTPAGQPAVAGNTDSAPVGSSSSTGEVSSSPVCPAARTSSSGTEQQPGTGLIDLGSKVEVAPVVIPPGMPLAFIYNIMQEQGLNYVPVIRQHGPLEGMVTR